MKTIALCANLPIEDAAWTMPAFGKKYPGSGWMKWLPSLDQSKNPRFMSGKQALHCVKDLCFPPSQVIVIQEENNPEGQELIKLGADARVNYCMESPIYASNYYDNIPKEFAHHMLFANGSEHLYFPCFDDTDILQPVDWINRKFLCMVVSNKHYAGLGDRYKDSPTYQMAMKTQFHDYRYEAIHHFKPGFNKDFDLYGHNWLPPIKGYPVADKLATIRNYKFALCFENGSYPGYITEKIIDCLVAGVIPVYRGAPDIQRYVPPDLYLDASVFKSFEHMEKTLREAHWYHDYIIKTGQYWLRSLVGQKYNNRVFAKRILELCE